MSKAHPGEAGVGLIHLLPLVQTGLPEASTARTEVILAEPLDAFSIAVDGEIMNIDQNLVSRAASAR